MMFTSLLYILSPIFFIVGVIFFGFHVYEFVITENVLSGYDYLQKAFMFMVWSIVFTLWYYKRIDERKSIATMYTPLQIENVLKVVRIGTNKSNINEIQGEHPIENIDGTSFYTIVKDRWYHNIITKLKYKYFVWKYNRKGKCTCECHFIPGFYHCFDPECCDKPNFIYK